MRRKTGATILGTIATSLLLPLWYAMGGGALPAVVDTRVGGIPVAVLFVLGEMALLVLLCWLSMKVVAEAGPVSSRDREGNTGREADAQRTVG